jgi:lipoprotein signal peptidase
MTNQFPPPSNDTSVETHDSALGDVRSHFVFWTVAVSALVLDLWTKAWSFSALGPHEERVIIPGWLNFRRSLNDGAVFGSFTGYVSLFIAASVGALLFVLFLFYRSRPRQYLLHVSLALILSGALGNLYDRAYMEADVVRLQRGGEWQTAMIGIVRSFATSSSLSRAFPIGFRSWPDAMFGHGSSILPIQHWSAASS